MGIVIKILLWIYKFPILNLIKKNWKIKLINWNNSFNLYLSSYAWRYPST